MIVGVIVQICQDRLPAQFPARFKASNQSVGLDLAETILPYVVLYIRSVVIRVARIGQLPL